MTDASHPGYAGLRVLVLDNFDSFTYNLVQYLGELGAEPVVFRNNSISVGGVAELGVQAVVVSPGPCTPAEAGISVPLIQEWGSRLPVLGVCLGHQSIGAAYGARIVRAGSVMHGKTSLIEHTGSGIFDGLASPLRVMRYHSLVIEPASVPPELIVEGAAAHDRSEIHAVRHAKHNVFGVQFHPESILTEGGKRILHNFLTIAASAGR